MPHISVKMLKGRTPEQKEKAAKALADTLCEVIGCSKSHLSVTVEDFTAEEWQDVFRSDVTEKSDSLYITPQYDPKDLL